MERKVGSKAIWTIATLVVVLVALATWLVIPVMSVVLSIDKELIWVHYSSESSLRGKWWEMDAWWLYYVSYDMSGAFDIDPIMTVVTVAYVLLAVPLWPLAYMAIRRKLHSTPRHFLAYLVSTSAAVGLGLVAYRIIPSHIHLYAHYLYH